MPEKTEVLRGRLYFYSETGTEGGHWAFQNEEFITTIEMEPSMPGAVSEEEVEIYLYEGMHILENGDRLKIFDKNDPEEIVWEGEVSLKCYRTFTESAFGFWIHADQKGVPKEIWAKWFMEEYPAEFTKNKHGAKPN